MSLTHWIAVLLLSILPQASSLQEGWTLLNGGKYDEALTAFEHAVGEKPRDAAPRLGLAVSQAALGRVRESEQGLHLAESLAKTSEERLDVHVGAIQAYTIGGVSSDWLAAARGHFENGIRINNRYPALQYRMAQAYVAANDLGRAQDLYAQAVALKGEFAAAADREWNKIQKVVRASPATRLGAGIAMQDQISRADLCALLSGETGLEKLFTNTDNSAGASLPADIRNHPLRREIESVLNWRIRGLDPKADGSFAPNDPIRRGELALILEDILIQSTRDSSLASRYLGADQSPFPDVPPTHALFNAVMTVTSRSILEADLDGRYHPDDSAAGADVLIALRRLVNGK